MARRKLSKASFSLAQLGVHPAQVVECQGGLAVAVQRRSIPFDGFFQASLVGQGGGQTMQDGGAVRQELLGQTEIDEGFLRLVPL